MDVDPDEARRRLLEELSHPEYARRQSLLDRLLALVRDAVDVLTGRGGGEGGGIVVALVLLAVLALALALLVRRSGRVRRRVALKNVDDLLADPTATASELRLRAVAARDAGRHDDAVVLALRALVRDLSHRTLLDVTDGMTAHEAARGAAVSFPELRTRLGLAADAFDTAAYSHRPVTPKQADDVVRLVEYLAESSPAADALSTAP